MKYKIALAQMDSGSDMPENLNKIRTLTAQAADAGAKLVVFPETVEYIGPKMADHASDLPGPMSEFFAGLAKEHRIHLCTGSVSERNADGRAYNTSLLFSDEGEQLAAYRKLHLFDIDIVNGPSVHESKTIAPGREITVCSTPLGILGFTVCYDLRFPELFRLLALKGAEVILVPANFTADTGAAHWESLLRARAIENTCYIAAVGQVGQKPKYRAYGNSMVVNPWGTVIARGSGDREELVIAEIDTDRVAEVRMQMPSLTGRRTDIYTLKEEI